MHLSVYLHSTELEAADYKHLTIESGALSNTFQLGFNEKRRNYQGDVVSLLLNKITLSKKCIRI